MTEIKVWVLRLSGWEQPCLIQEGNLESELKKLDISRGIVELYQEVLK
jgi:hypothetical protein